MGCMVPLGCTTKTTLDVKMLKNSMHKLLLIITPYMEYCKYTICLHISVDKEEIKAFKGKIKESPWCNREIVFRIAVL